MSHLGKIRSSPGFARNAAWNCFGTLSDGLIGFFMMPFLVRTMGDTTYGLWTLIASLTGCFGFLDLGVRGALGRQLAFHLARRDRNSVNAVFNTALALLLVACAITLVGVVALQIVFFRLIDVSPDRECTVRLALLLAGLNLAISFPISAFDGTLWAAQRFDRLNQIDISVAVLKAAIMLFFLKSPAAIVSVPAISLLGLFLAVACKSVVTWKVLDGLRIDWSCVSRRAIGELFGFGVWNVVGSAARQVLTRIPAVVIGSIASPAAVTPYAIAEKLLTLATSLFSAATGVLTPKSAGYSAVDDNSRLQTLFLQGGRLCWAMALFAGLGMCLFGRSFIAAWLGAMHPQAPVYLAIISIGAILPLSQSLTNGVLLGAARHQFLAVIALGQTALAIVLSALAAPFADPRLVCGALAIASTVGGLVTVWHGCRALHLTLAGYAREAILPAIGTCILPAIAGEAMEIVGCGVSVYGLVAEILMCAILFAVSCQWMGLRPAVDTRDSGLPSHAEAGNI